MKLLEPIPRRVGIAVLRPRGRFRLFWFLTKPFFWALDFIGTFFGNFGVAILLFTVFVKAAFFPLANKSYKVDEPDEGACSRR